MSNFIKASDVCFSYSGYRKVINCFNFKLKRGEFVAFVGENGSGKSTIARLFNAILRPTTGTILVDGLNTLDIENSIEIKKKVGVVFQNPDNQIFATTVEEDVAFAPENFCWSRDRIQSAVDKSLGIVDMLKFKDCLVNNLSGGQKQRVAIAGVLAMDADCIVFDESTSMLDPAGRRDILSIMKKLNTKFHKTIINITHDMDEVVLADRVVILKNGRILKEGSVADVLSDETVLSLAHLKMPKVCEFVKLLRSEGIPVSRNIFDVDGCVIALTKLLRRL